MSEPLLNHVVCPDAGAGHRMAYWEWGAPEATHVVLCVHGLSRQGRDFDVLAQALLARSGGAVRVVAAATDRAKVKVTALVFKKIDVEQFVVALAKAHLSDDSRLFEKSVTINYRPSTFDVQKKIITLNLDSSFKKYYYIDTLELINLFSTKSSDQIKQIVDQKYNGNIFELKVNFWPFWVRRAPSDQDRIKVDLILE